MTKYLTRAEYEMVMELVRHEIQEGKSKSAPKLELLDDHPLGHDQELYRIKGQDLICYCTGVGKAM